MAADALSEGLDAAASALDAAALAVVAAGPAAVVAMKLLALGLRIGAELTKKGADPVAELETLLAKLRVDTEGAWRAAEEARWPAIPPPAGSSPR